MAQLCLFQPLNVGKHSTPMVARISLGVASPQFYFERLAKPRLGKHFKPRKNSKPLNGGKHSTTFKSLNGGILVGTLQPCRNVQMLFSAGKPYPGREMVGVGTIGCVCGVRGQTAGVRGQTAWVRELTAENYRKASSSVSPLD